MNYKEKYKQALSRATFYNNELLTENQRKMLVDIFPELKESENEKIRKAIIAYIDHGQHNGISNKDMVAWLEKQERALNPDKVIEWLENKQSSIDLYNKFRKDFRI